MKVQNPQKKQKHCARPWTEPYSRIRFVSAHVWLGLVWTSRAYTVCWLTAPEQSDNLSVCCTYDQVLFISFPQTDMSLHGALLSPKIILHHFFSSEIAKIKHIFITPLLNLWGAGALYKNLMDRSDHMCDCSVILSVPCTSGKKGGQPMKLYTSGAFVRLASVFMVYHKQMQTNLY